MADPAAVFEACYAAYLQEDWETLAGLLAENVVLASPGRDGIRGRDAVLEYHRATRRAFPDMGGVYTVVIGSGDHACGRKVLSGTNTGPIALGDGVEIPPTGHRIEVPETDWMLVRDGLCHEHSIFYDRFEMLRQLGLLPAR